MIIKNEFSKKKLLMKNKEQNKTYFVIEKF